MLKRIVTIQDISCFGKCSLTVAHPILSAMGIETAVIPTAVLSTHTGGFTSYTFRDLTSDIPAIAKHWKFLQLQFDGIYTGYLGSKEQVQIVSDFFQTFRSTQTKIIVDPVMGDGGKLYPGFTSDFVQEMKTLCRQADVIVPNMTEEETAFVLEQLKLAREQAIDYKNMKQISAVFEIYKTKCEQYFNEHGRNWRQMFKDYVNKRNAEKKAQGKKK